MANRRALLIGIAQYGDGFAPLPAALHDVAAMNAALRASGWHTEICPDDVAANAAKLDTHLRDFCAQGGADDQRLIYFSGHGLRVDGVDCLVPSGTARVAAAVSPAQRVSTDMGATVAASAVGLVLFIIDACRDVADVAITKGGGGWGDPATLARPDESRFVRWFGCAAGEVGQVLALPPAADRPGEAVSLFTQALVQAMEQPGDGTLATLQAAVEQHCQALLAQHPTLQRQTPHLGLGELNTAKRAVMQKSLFAQPTAPALASLWPMFRPEALHCLVLLSEHAADRFRDWGLADLVREALAGDTGDAIWQAFRSAHQGLRLVDGRERQLPVAIDAEHLVLASVPVLDALVDADTLARVARALAEADLVVVDVTHFEPSVMLLAGIRSACRRGVTVCSHGDDWVEGTPLDIPFNLQDLNLNSHTPTQQATGVDPVVARFVQRVQMGFEQLSRQPGYQDLPGYDALRELGADYSAAATLSVAERVLVLCSFDKGFLRNWRFVAAQLKQALSRRQVKPRRIERVIDIGSPQLVLQGLYEQIRRTAACVVDWSGFRASVFLELGARLAVSEWGAAQIVDADWLPGGERAEREALENAGRVLRPVQIQCLQRLFAPQIYRCGEACDAQFDAVAQALVRRGPDTAATDAAHRVYRAVLGAIHCVQPAQLPVAEALRRRADALHHPQQTQVGAPQVLYAGNPAIKQDAERAAVELRVAAWLYLEHRFGRASSRADPIRARLYDELGRAAMDGLYDLGGGEDIALAALIEERLDAAD